MNHALYSNSETGSVAQQTCITLPVSYQAYSVDIGYSLNVFDSPTIGTLRLIFRWLDPFGVARVYDSTALSALNTPMLTGHFMAWIGADEVMSLEIVAAVSLGTLEYGYKTQWTLCQN